jgi:hypothetical protein
MQPIIDTVRPSYVPIIWAGEMGQTATSKHPSKREDNKNDTWMFLS